MPADLTAPPWLRGGRGLLAGSALLVLVYALTMVVSWPLRGVDPAGPLRPDAPAVTADVPGAAPLERIRAACLAGSQFSRVENPESGAKPDVLKIVTGEVDGVRLFGCFDFRQGDPNNIWAATVVDAGGRPADAALVQASGAWEWIGLVKKPYEAVLGGLALALVGGVYWRYHRLRRPDPDLDRWRRLLAGVLMVVPVVGYLVGLFLVDRDRLRYTFQNVIFWFGFAWLITFGAWVGGPADGLGLFVVLIMLAGLLWGWLGGRFLVGAAASPGSGTLDAGTAPIALAPPVATTGAAVARGGGAVPGGAVPAAASTFRVRRSGELSTFAAVGGMAALKAELEDTFGLLMAYAAEADAYRIEFNGLLLHGPPGVGKTFVAEAVAGEYGMSFVPVTTGDLVSTALVGEGARRVEEAFAVAAANIPCVLFFDEFDSVAGRRDDQPGPEATRTVNSLLTSLERYRAVDELVVMAATNHLDKLDPAVVRAGRFDRHIRVDLPDADARGAILEVQLAGRPTGRIDLPLLVRRTDGFTPATLAAVVSGAALAALQQSVAGGGQVLIDTDHLLGALAARGGKDRPQLAGHDWDSIILDQDVKAELRQIQQLIESPDLAEQYGVKPPSGVLLTGPPGTGKTTLARVLAAQTSCSFYVVSPADLTSKWVGESEELVQRLFERARGNAPSIIFIDEIDAVAAVRGELGSSAVDNAMLTQLLTQLDGLHDRGRVYVIGATNRPEAIDPALLRPGRLSRVIEIPPPGRAARGQLLALFTRRMTISGVDLDDLAGRTEGWSGADLEGLCQQAAVRAMVTASAGERPEIAAEDFEYALSTLTAARSAIARARADNQPISALLRGLTGKAD